MYYEVPRHELYLSLSVGLQPLWTLTAFSISNLYRDGSTSWTEDQPHARPLLIHRTTHTQNKRTQTTMAWVGLEPTTPVFERGKSGSCLRQRCHWDRREFSLLTCNYPQDTLLSTIIRHFWVIQIKILFELIPCSLLESYQRFGESCCFHLLSGLSSTLKREAASSSETFELTTKKTLILILPSTTTSISHLDLGFSLTVRGRIWYIYRCPCPRFLAAFRNRRCAVIPILSFQAGGPPHLSRQWLLIQYICNHPPWAGAKD
jgi:hypothetical protein